MPVSFITPTLTLLSIRLKVTFFASYMVGMQQNLMHKNKQMHSVHKTDRTCVDGGDRLIIKLNAHFLFIILIYRFYITRFKICNRLHCNIKYPAHPYC